METMLWFLVGVLVITYVCQFASKMSTWSIYLEMIVHIVIILECVGIIITAFTNAIVFTGILSSLLIIVCTINMFVKIRDIVENKVFS